jgi:hypothetical protein
MTVKEGLLNGGFRTRAELTGVNLTGVKSLPVKLFHLVNKLKQCVGRESE